MQNQYHRFHIRMMGEQYARLKENSKNAGMPMNKYLMKQLVRMKPFVFPADEIMELADMTNDAGRRINEIARAFNGGYGQRALLDETVELLKPVHERMHVVMKKKDAAEAEWAKEAGFVMPIRCQRHAVHKNENKCLMVRMNGEQYDLFEEYVKKSRYSRKLFFCRLADGVPFDGNGMERLMAYGGYSPINSIGNNIRQIVSNPIACKLDTGRIRQLEFIMARLYTMIGSIMRFNLMSDAIRALSDKGK